MRGGVVQLMGGMLWAKRWEAGMLVGDLEIAGSGMDTFVLAFLMSDSMIPRQVWGMSKIRG